MVEINWILPEVQVLKKCFILVVLSEKWWSRTSPFLEDILYEVPEISGGGPHGWGHLHSTGFCLRFPTMYNTWGIN